MKLWLITGLLIIAVIIFKVIMFLGIHQDKPLTKEMTVNRTLTEQEELTKFADNMRELQRKGGIYGK